MRSRVALVLTTILVVSAFLMPAAAAAAQSSAEGPRSFSSLVDIQGYLTSMRVDFGGATIQLGSRNYAGPNCPGSDWSCTTASAVIQFGNTNLAEVRNCTPSEGAGAVGDTCDILQFTPVGGGNNVARCFIDTRDVLPAPTQTCTIMQTNTTGDNHANVDLAIRQDGGATGQTATQSATVTQLNDSGNNYTDIHEGTDQKSDETQSQQACQNVVVKQTSLTGRNDSNVHQSQKQSLRTDATTVSQTQNTNACPFNLTSLRNLNVNASVDQNPGQNPFNPTSTGANQSQLHQSIDQDEKAEKATTDGTQVQGSSSGGLSGDVAQTSTGVSKSVNHQTEKQTQKAKKNSGVSQRQYGPAFCCTLQMNNPANRFDINQSSDQSSNGMNTSQQTILDGKYDTSGDGMITQRVMNNTEKLSNQTSGTGFHHLSCTSGVEGSCDPEPPPSPN